MVFTLYGMQTYQATGQLRRLEVCQTADGYVIGTRDDSGRLLTQESLQYWDTKDQAHMAMCLGDWSQRHVVADSARSRDAHRESPGAQALVAALGLRFVS